MTKAQKVTLAAVEHVAVPALQTRYVKVPLTLPSTSVCAPSLGVVTTTLPLRWMSTVEDDTPPHVTSTFAIPLTLNFRRLIVMTGGGGPLPRLSDQCVERYCSSTIAVASPKRFRFVALSRTPV